MFAKIMCLLVVVAVAHAGYAPVAYSAPLHVGYSAGYAHAVPQAVPPFSATANYVARAAAPLAYTAPLGVSYSAPLAYSAPAHLAYSAPAHLAYSAPLFGK